MAWVKFVKEFEFDFRPQKGCCQVYRASETPLNLPERVVAAAEAVGAGVRVERPEEPRPEEQIPQIQRAKGRKQKEQ